MSLSPGSHIGPYEVIEPLGKGAMGVVFRARDTRLQRDVALKLLPDHFANEPDRLSRFQKEAQVLASLNHTNIAQIYGLETVNGSICIVMELVEGETLEDRLKQGGFSYEETVDIARQLADALAAAHERGIVHRDLKPANIKLTPSGTAKILDFGLAKALGPKASDIHMSVLPTMASGSIVGSIVGTPGYMSPEQARGKDVDARTDIWAFGCVIYEMLCGQQAFSGETITDVMAKVVTSPPDLNLLPKDTPTSMRLLLSAALNKSASHRLQHIGDSHLFLDGPLVAETGKSNIAAAPRAGIRGKLLVAILVAALAIVAIPAALYFRGGERQPEMQFEISFPGMVGQPLVSPNGRSVIYGAPSSSGKTSLWLRPVNSSVAQQLSGTENVAGAMWSPDNQKLLFVSDGKIKKLDIAGGSTQSLGELGNTRGADWNRSGVLLFARISDNVIVRMSETGGELTPITKLDASRKEILHALPVFLPDGNHFLYLAVSGKPEESGVFLASIDSKTTPQRMIAIQPNRFNAMAFVPQGYLLILNDSVLTAYRLSNDGAPQGEPVVVAEDVESFTVSQTGLLLYRKAQADTGKQLVWFDRQGKQDGEVGVAANYGTVDLSPKGDRAAVDMTVNNNSDIWVVDLARGIPLRITFDPARDWTAVWSPDGTRIAFASTRAAGTQIYEKSATGSGDETVISPNESNAIPVHWTPDDKYIVFSKLKQSGPSSSRTYDTWLMPVSGERKAIPYLETGFDKFHARVSPDGRWIAYATNESGMYQIVVQTFPDPNGGKWQISAEGGVEPKWRRDSRELYYLGLDGKLMAVSISGPAFQAARPVPLFQTPLAVTRNQPTRDRRYDVSPDGRFLIAVPAAISAPLPITVVVNWTARFDK